MELQFWRDFKLPRGSWLESLAILQSDSPRVRAFWVAVRAVGSVGLSFCKGTLLGRQREEQRN